MRVTDDAGQRWYSLRDALTPRFFFPLIHDHSFRQVMRGRKEGLETEGLEEEGLVACVAVG